MMQTTFLNTAGTVLFVRDDMEQGNWTQEEYTVNATFPYVDGKVIERGQRIAFRDPATNNIEMFEIRNVNNIEPEHYQQIIAEHIALAELSDEHINNTEITDKTAAQALGTALTGTLWSVGNSTASGTSSGDFGRGSVWQAVGAIMTNWNVYITPRVTVNSAGSITGRYLDITPAEGVWRGVRLSIDKNMSDSSVVYDDSDVLTALYGYGGNINVPQSGGAQDTQEELTFKDVVWSATSSHPAKPSGQTYLEDPAKTALYGRNGRARFGYYQNADIKDANVLLEKTWEALKATSDPKISISGSVTDLYRLGYADQPLRLHDLVIVEIKETGETFQKEIIRLDVDLIDPTATRPEIGDYIPNIIYINRDTGEQASSGGGGGGRGGRGKTNLVDATEKLFYQEFVNDERIGMVVGTYNGGYKIEGGQITLAINDDGGTTAKIDADCVDIAGVIQVINDDAGASLIISADAIDIQGVVNALSSMYIACAELSVGGGTLEIGSGATYSVDISGSLGVSGDISASASGQVSAGTGSFTTAWIDNIKIGGTSHAVSWNSYTARWCTLSSSFTFEDTGGTSRSGRLVTGYTDTPIYYLGY